MSETDSSKRIRLTVEGGPTREFPGDRTFVIGRSQVADFSIPHPNLSREHVRVSLKDGEVWMEDLGSANGTFVQGQRIPAKATVKIKPGYRVLLGTGSNVIVLFEAVDGYEPLPDPEPKGDVDLPTARERTLAAITRNQAARAAETPEERERTRNTITHGKSVKMELDFPQQHFPHEVKKEKVAELRIIEAKKQRVIEDIQYKEREVDDLRSKIRDMREESLKLKEQTEGYKREVQPLAERKADLEKCVAELDVIYEEKIDTLETGFRELKATLEESQAVRMARSDKEYKERVRKLDEEYARKLQQLENETESVRGEGERLRDTLIQEKKTLEETLRRVRAEAQEVEAERRLLQARVDTEVAQLQGQKQKLENEIEFLRRDREKLGLEARSIVEHGNAERARLDEARRAVKEAKAEYEQVRATIASIKSSEEKNLLRIEELRQKIVELDGRAEGIAGALRQAEEDGAAIRKRAKEEAEAERAALLKKTESETTTQLKTAREHVEAQLRLVEQQATERLQAAEQQAKTQLQAAEFQASARIQAAEAQSTARINSAEIHAATLIANAETEVANHTHKGQAEANTLVETAKREGDQYYEAKKLAADELYLQACARAEEVESGTKGHSERAMAEAHLQIETKRKQFESELNDMRRKNEQEIRQVRANALADIEAAREREAREFTTKLRSRAKEIGDQIERIVGSKLTAQLGVTMDPVSLRAFSEEIHHIVGTVIGGGKGSKNTSKTSTNIETTLNNVLPADTQARDRAVQYWKRMGIAAGVCFVLLMGKILFPGVYSKVGTAIGSALEIKDNTDAVVRRMLRERQLSMTFVTEQDQQFRDSYTDNILYTEGFIEMKEDVETQKVWTLGLNKFFQSELGLTEKAIVQFGSAEGRVVRELIELRANIIPAASEAGIQKMREGEAPVLNEMKFIVRSDANWQKFLAYHRNFYQKYAETFINRAPASTPAAE